MAFYLKSKLTLLRHDVILSKHPCFSIIPAKISMRNFQTTPLFLPSRTSASNCRCFYAFFFTTVY